MLFRPAGPNRGSLVDKAKAEKDLEARLLSALESEDLGEIGDETFGELRRKATRVSQGRA